jgi:hypothetical protein
MENELIKAFHIDEIIVYTGFIMWFIAGFSVARSIYKK